MKIVCNDTVRMGWEFVMMMVCFDELGMGLSLLLNVDDTDWCQYFRLSRFIVYYPG